MKRGESQVRFPSREQSKRRPIPSRGLVESLESRLLLSANLLQFHEDAGSTGQDLTETVLTPSNVNSSDFGRQFVTQLDGQVYAQPLAVNNVNIIRGSSIGAHNVLYVATMNDSLFAVDANTGAILWQDSFLQITDPRVTTILSPNPTAGVIAFPENGLNGTENAGVNVNDVTPEEGIFGTPVINPTTNILYCIAYTQERRNDTPTSATPSAVGSDWHFVERLWAVNLSDGGVAITPTNQAAAPMPTAGGEVIADTVLNPTTGTYPPFTNFTGYEYFAGPNIKASGENGGSFPNADGWVTNPDDLTSAASHSIFAGTTPTADGEIALNAIIGPTRTGLTLINGVIYFGTTSHGDNGPYYGWVLGYSATTLQNVATFVTTPTYENYNIVSGYAGSNATEYDAEGAIWGGEQSITTDGTFLYFSIGNGAFDWTSSNFSSSYTTTDSGNTVDLPIDGDYGNSVLKLAIDPNANQGALNINSLPTTYNPDGATPGINGQNVNGFGLKVVDFFTPSDLLALNHADQDLGSGGVTLLPNTVTSTVPGHLGDPMLVTGGKSGRVYLIDRNNMGGFNTSYFLNNTTYANGTAIFTSPGSGVPNAGPDARLYDRVLGEYTSVGSVFTIPAFYQNGSTPTLIIDGNSNANRSFSVTSFQYTQSPPATSVNPAVLASTTTTFSNHGSTSAISANGSTNAIVWNIDTKNSSSDDLLAYTISLGAPIYDSSTVSTDALTGGVTNATATKFSQASVFDGMVYVGTGAGFGAKGPSQTAFQQGAIVGYGLRSTYLTSISSLFGAPTILTGYYQAATGAVLLNWNRNSTSETETEIDRSTNGSNWSVLAYAPNGSSSFTDTTAALGQTYYYRVRAISGANATAYAASPQIIATPPTLVSAVSSKTQGSAGAFALTLPISGSPGIEDRTGGPTQLVLTFASPIVEGASFGDALTSGSISSTAVSGSTLTVNLSGATNGQTLVLTLNDLRDAATNASGNYTFEVGVLLGDINGDGVVNSTDITIAKLDSGETVNANNFTADINGDGVINSTDITLAKLSSGDSLQPATTVLSSGSQLLPIVVVNTPTMPVAPVVAAPITSHSPTTPVTSTPVNTIAAPVVTPPKKNTPPRQAAITPHASDHGIFSSDPVKPVSDALLQDNGNFGDVPNKSISANAILKPSRSHAPSKKAKSHP